MAHDFSKPGAGPLHGTLAAHVARGTVPGLVALVDRRGEVRVEALGRMSLEGPDQVRRDAIFRIASMTKPIIAAATMILVEEGRLTLDGPVDRLLPELANRRVLKRLDGPLDETLPAARPITVRDLLTFRMGFGILMTPPGTYPIQRAADGLDLGQGLPQPQRPPAPDEWIRRFGTLPLMRQPGEAWIYNTGADVLGVLIARASGQPLETFLRQRFFEPLGMKDTGFSVPPAKLDRLVTSYLTDPRTGALTRYDAPRDSQWGRPPAFPSGGGGLVSTADDFLAFARMLLDGGTYRGKRILSAASVQAMTTDQLTPDQRAAAGPILDGRGWGFGLSLDGTRYGWDGGLGTSWRSDPGRGRIEILLTQASMTSPVPPKVFADFWAAASQELDR